MIVQQIRVEIDDYLRVFESISSSDRTYIDKSTNNSTDDKAFSYMYLLAKIYKQPLKTRAIISYSGSIFYGIAKYTDMILKKIVRKMPCVASSKNVIKKLIAKKWDATCTLFTMDATSMYTNIHFEHAKDAIEQFLPEHPLGQVIVEQEGNNINALIFALRIVMNYNVFKFGDTFWLQIAGTAMGGPPAPNYATLYFAIWEVTIVPTFPELEFYERYINDGFSIWKPLFPNNDAYLALFKESIQSFGANHPFFLDNPDHQPLH